MPSRSLYLSLLKITPKPPVQPLRDSARHEPARPDSSLASIQELLSPRSPPRSLEAENSSPDSAKQLVHYTAQPLLLREPSPRDMGSSNLPVLFELGDGFYFSEGDDYADDPTISLLTGSEPPKAKDPTVS